MKKFIILCGFIPILMGCPSVEESSTPTNSNYESYQTSSTSTDTSTVTNNIEVSDNKFSLKTIKINHISQSTVFPYCSKPIANSTVTATFEEADNTSLILKLKEDNFQWESRFIFTEELSGELFIGYTKYTANARSQESGEIVPIEITVDKNDNIEKLQIGNRWYTKKPDSTVTSNNGSSSGLKELDANQVEVQSGQTLRILVNLYNKKYSPKVTVSQICKNNKLGPNCVVHVGQVLQF